MPPPNNFDSCFTFIPRKSESSEQIRSFSWEKSPLGTVDSWPVVLKTVLSTMLKVQTPMYLIWGKSQIQFGNDAFLKLEASNFRIGATTDFAFADKIFQGESLAIPFQEIESHPIFNFSPVFGDENKIIGILGVYEQELVGDNQFSVAQLIEQSPIGIAVLTGKDYILSSANKQYQELIGRSESIVGKKLFEVMPELIGQQIDELIDGVMETGILYKGEESVFEIVKNGIKEKMYVNFVYSPFRQKQKITGVLVLAIDVTQLIQTRLQLEKREQKLEEMINRSPFPVTILRGIEMVIEMANPAMYEQIWRRSANEVVGKKLLDVFPELLDQKYPELLKHIFTSGISFSEKEAEVVVSNIDSTRKYYLDYENLPLFDDDGSVVAIMITANDVTDRVLNRQAVEESKTRLRIAIEASEIGTFDWNISTDEFIYSKRLAQIFGHEKIELLSHNDFSNQVHPDDRQTRLEAHKQGIISGKLFYEARFIKPDSTIAWLRLNGKVFFDSTNKPERIHGTVLDITAYKIQTDELERLVEMRTEEIRNRDQELKQSEDRYRKMTDEVQDYAIIMLSINGIILNWNQGAEKIKGYTEKEIIGKYFNIFYLQEDRKNLVPEDLLQEAINNGRASQEGWRLRKDDTIFWASIVITALHDEKNNLLGFSKVTRDLTERKLAEDKMKQYTAELEFQNRELEQFAYIASHDLQEPLRKIQTFSSMLEQSWDNRDLAQTYLSKIKKSASRMTDLIKAVLNYSKISTASNALEKVDLNELLEQVKFDFELLISEKNASIVADQLPEIHGIPLQLSQLFSNLIGNSLKFVDKQPEISIKARLLADKEEIALPNLKSGVKYIEIVFADNGIGFETQYATQIFNLFQRLHDKQSYSGTGIGLALCKRIVENHHGHIVATSTAGVGASFKVYLPV